MENVVFSIVIAYPEINSKHRKNLNETGVHVLEIIELNPYFAKGYTVEKIELVPNASTSMVFGIIVLRPPTDL